jgi:hypothetical protein
MKDWKFTPLHIELMLHYYCCCAEFRGADAPAVIEYTGHLEASDLIKSSFPSKAKYCATEMGEAFVKRICNTELPVRTWN